jgi:hypothetical protein
MINIENIKEQIIERAAEKLAERLWREMEKEKGNVPYIPRRPFGEAVMYGCPTDYPVMPQITATFTTPNNEKNE